MQNPIMSRPFRRLLPALISGLLLPTAILAAEPGGAVSEPLSAAVIIEKNVQARGGAAAWRNARSLLLRGQMDAGGRTPTALPVVLELKRPNKVRVALQFKGKTAVQVFDGESGWKLRPFLGRDEAEPFTPEETREAAAQSELDGPLLDFRAKGTQIALEGTERIEGRDTYRLRLSLRDGTVSHAWIDAATFLEARIEAAPHRVDGHLRRVMTYFRDYRSVDGLVVPFVVETAVEGQKNTHRMSFSKVKVNLPLEDALFARQGLEIPTPEFQ